MPKTSKSAPFLAAKYDGYAINAQTETGSAELTFYGDVVSSRPYDYSLGKPSKEKFIVQDEILADLEKISKCKSLNIRLNSCGGSCNTAIVIHNKLRELSRSGMEITCTVDGVAMSAGSHIMCAADKVKASEGSLIMIHKAAGMLFGYYNSDELRNKAAMYDSYDKAIAAAYKRKTGKTEEELLKMMSAETFMTGAEAKEQGFVDELVEGESNVKISASADRTALYVNDSCIKLHGALCPEYIPVTSMHEQGTENTALMPDADIGAGNANTIPNNTNEGGKTIMAENLAELQKENPTLAASIEAEIRNSIAGENANTADTAVQAALKAERERLEKIEAIAGQVSPELLADAKYKNPCTAEELAYKAMTENAKKGANFLADMNADYENSGAGKVKAVAPQDDITGKGEDEEKVKNEVDEFIAGILKEGE